MLEVRPGEVIADRYRVERVLAEGPRGAVALATEGDARVALRILRPPVSGDAFVRADGTRNFRSDHLPRVLEVAALPDGSVYVASEWADGEDLATMLASRGPLDPAEAAEIVLQACDALAEAHRVSRVHGRVDPTRIFVATGEDGAPRAKVVGLEVGPEPIPGRPDVRLDDPGRGWVRYAAPEAITAANAADPQADVWSLGMILYELATKRLPFKADTVGQLLSAILTQPHEPLASIRPDLPKSYVSVVDRALHIDLERRCQDVSEISAVLAAIAPRRARAVAARVELRLHGTLPSLERIIRQEARTDPPETVVRTVSRPPPALVKSTPPPPPAEPTPTPTPAATQTPTPPAPESDSDPEPPAPAEASNAQAGLSPRVVGAVALFGVVAAGALALRARAPESPGIGVAQPTSAMHDAGTDAGPTPVSSRRPAP